MSIMPNELERRRKISETLKGFKRPPFSEEHRKNMSIAGKGKKLSEETKKKMVFFKKGNQYAKGLKHTEEWKSKMRGRVPWNKGHSTGLETKRKISESKKGQPSKRKGKPLLSLRGQRHPNWTGTSNVLKLVRNQVELVNWRMCVFARDNFTCKMCKKRGSILNAHHIKRFKDYPALRFEISNGITLCVPCHNMTKGNEESFEEIFVAMI